MNDDQLRARLRRADPAASTPVDPVTSPRAHELLERTVQTDPQPRATRPAAASRPAPGSRTGRLALLGAAAAAVLVAGGAVLLAGDATPDGAPGGGTTDPARGTLALTVQPFDPLTGICPVFEASQLEGLPVALAGTATAVDGGTVTLRVTRWYRGGEAGTVVLQGPPDPALTGFEVRQGAEYLISASDGTVAGCGLSGLATPELQEAYDSAF